MHDIVLPNPSVDLTVTGIAWEWQIKSWFQTKASHMLTYTLRYQTTCCIIPFAVESLGITPLLSQHLYYNIAEIYGRALTTFHIVSTHPG